MRRAWPGLGYAVLFAVLAWPWLRAATEAAPYGNPYAFADDARFWVWQLGWVAHALATDPLRVLDANIHHPAPHALTGSEHLASTQLLAVPAVWITGNPLLVANLLVWASYPVAALAMRAVLLALGCGAAVAWTGGLVFALGPLRVPANFEVIHFLNVYVALAALCLHRLRDAPRPGRAIVLWIVLTAGALSGYYLAVMLALVTAVWTAGELVRRGPGRARFLAQVAGAGVAAGVVLLVASLPYFRRPEVVASLRVGGLLPIRFDAQLPAWIAMHGRLLFGIVPGALALAGLAAIASRDPVARRLALAGAVLAGVGLVLVFPPAPLVRAIEATPLRFLRFPFRFATVAGLGTALLAAAALELVRARRDVRAATAAAGLCAALVVVTHGFALSGARDPVAAFGAERALHDAVAATARADGAGPLLVLPLVDAHPERHGGVLPLGQLESDDMTSSVRHWLPLVGGHTGYPPLHRPVLEAAVRALPRSDALDELVDLTHVRWLLLRPLDYWSDPTEPERILALPGVTQRLARDGWVLARVERPVRRSQWYDAVRAGLRPGVTVLGTRLAPIPEPDAIATVRALAAVPAHAVAGEPIRVELAVTNAGLAPWPVVVPAGVARVYVVQAVATWRRLDADAPVERTALPLHRDVPAGDVVVETGEIRAPQTPGTYELAIGIEQEVGARFDGPRNAPLRPQVVVAGRR